MRNFPTIILSKCENCGKFIIGGALTELMEDVTRVIVDRCGRVFEEESINWLNSTTKVEQF